MTTSQFRIRPLAVAIMTLVAPLCLSVLADTTATTDPVGFITLALAGTGGATASALSFAGLGLTRPVEYQGNAESVGANSITDNEATWTDSQFNGASGAYFVEITSGTGAGTTYDVSATVAATKTLTFTQNLGVGVASGATFKIRKHWTIGSIFGSANEAGLQPGNASSADQVLVYNGSTYDTYYFSNAGGLVGNGWRKVGGGSTDRSATTVYPDDGMIVQRSQSAAVNVVLMGAVKTGQTSIPVLSGLNITGNVYAANMTLSSSGIYTGNSSTGVASGNASTADTVQIYNGSTYDTYYYSNSGGLVGNGWRKVGGGSTDQASVPITVGSAVIIQRKAGASFDWVPPQHPAIL